MNNFKLYVDNIFRTTIKGKDEKEIRSIAIKNYGMQCNIRVVKL